MTNTTAAPLSSALWTRACSVEVGQTSADRGTLLTTPELLGNGLARFHFVLGPVVLPLDCDIPIIDF
jgi:hypothetical protein